MYCPNGSHQVFLWPNGVIVPHFGDNGRKCPASYTLYPGEKDLQAYQQRVIEEKMDLDEKIGKLEDFIFRSQGKWFDVPEDERLRMTRQFCSMKDYSQILGERIQEFK